ncbi:hypothetical protein [Psychrobacillus soli]|uniref:Uncharacterized protein n=1 Tax=Psychrobacillus soli TaxID=1543965 RepID=A0A544TJ20_9BACI|nr:hypothetical protein [Psychrobacillus soli]TQR17450.1 hypothetical protein FG383_05180 [Psychrobacillus soli]
MIDNIIENYKKYRKKTLKKGYQIVGIPLTLSFFGLLLITILNFFLILEYNNWLILIEIFLVIILWRINKKVDNLLRISWSNNEGKLKDYIACYLKDEGFIRSQQFKDFSVILREKSKQKHKKYDLNPYIAMVVAIIIFTLSLLTNDSLRPLIVTVAICCIFIVISINPMVNTFTNIFLNRDSEIIYELANIVDELYFEASIKEL